MINEIQTMKSHLISFHKEVLREISPYIIEKKQFLNSDKWHHTSQNLHLYNHKDKFFISSDGAVKEYISFQEKNNSYGIVPSQKIRILPKESIDILIKGQTLGGINAVIMLVEYSHTEKLKLHQIPLNKAVKITTDQRARCLRMAIRISGTGVLMLEDLEFNRVGNDNEGIIETPKKRKKNKIASVSDLNIACIFDEFTRTCYEKEVNLISFTPENWREVLEQNIPDFLMVESAWKGNSGSWEYKIASYNNQDQTCLFELLDWCKKRNIPTVFWNKEDPIHFNKFIKTAKHFDYIFTTDENMIDAYKKDSGHENVFALPFSAEPKLHNPVKIGDSRENKICFAGSYYANRHADRKKDMDDLLDICADYGLDIFDRNYKPDKKVRDHFSFPERFNDNIIGSLKYDEIEKAYKGYKMMLNVNSVKHSPTMFSRRIFEGLACGTPIVSSYSEGIRKIFKDIVLISENPDELKDNIGKLMDDERFYREKSLLGMREVFTKHTYKNRIKTILDKMGIVYDIKYPKVTVVGIVSSKEEFHRLVNQFEDQTWREKELVVFVKLFDGYTDLLNEYNKNGIKTYLYSYLDHYSRLNEIVKTEYVSYFCPEDFYGDNYLKDFMIATIYTEADIIGKATYYKYIKSRKKLDEVKPNSEYEFTSNLFSHSSVINMAVFHGVELLDVVEGFEKNQPLNKYFKKGKTLFASDKFNYLQAGKNASEETRMQIEL